MAKRKGPKWDQTRGDDVTHRDIVVHRRGLEPPSNVTIYFDCPFCKNEVKAYLWSFSGGGKHCDCGALFGGSGGYQFTKLLTDER